MFNDKEKEILLKLATWAHKELKPKEEQGQKEKNTLKSIINKLNNK